jgi:hypothetical protein
MPDNRHLTAEVWDRKKPRAPPGKRRGQSEHFEMAIARADGHRTYCTPAESRTDAGRSGCASK